MDAVLERPTTERVAVPVRAQTQRPQNPPKPAQAQINVRLDRELKEAGDRGLARRGITPSQAVRALWKTVSNDDLASQKACDVLLGLDADEGLSEAARARLEALNRFDATRMQFLGKLEHAGIDFSTCAALTEEEAREARYEYLLEKSGA